MQVNPDTLMLKQELIDAIMEAIESLPLKDREVIQARINGLNHSEISEQLDISISASMNRLYRARKKLAAHIKNLLCGIISLPKMLPRLCQGVPPFQKIASEGEVATSILSTTQSLMFSVIFHVVLFSTLFSLPLNFHSDRQKVNFYLEVALIPMGEQPVQHLSRGKSAISVRSYFPAIGKGTPSKPPGGILSAQNLALQGETTVGQSMEKLQIGTGVSVKGKDGIFSGDGKGRDVLQIPADGSLSDLDGIKTNLSQNQTIPKSSFALPRKVKDITSPILSGAPNRLNPGIFPSTQDNLKSADLNLVIVLARSDLTLDFTLLLKDYISKYIAKIEEQGRVAKQSEYNIAFGMVVYSPANVHGAGIYSISSEKGRLGFLLSELDKIRGNVTFRRNLRRWRNDRRAIDGLSVALEEISFQLEAQWRILFVTRNKIGDILDLNKGWFRHYYPVSSLDEVIEKLRKAKIRVDVIGLDEPRARRLVRETGGSYSDVRLLEAGELKP
jgi:hypothetical protein